MVISMSVAHPYNYTIAGHVYRLKSQCIIHYLQSTDSREVSSPHKRCLPGKHTTLILGETMRRMKYWSHDGYVTLKQHKRVVPSLTWDM